MKHSCYFFAALVALTAVSQAAIVFSGGIADDLNPSGSDPTTWDDTIIGYIGFAVAGGNATVDVTPTSTLLSDTAHIGYNLGVSGYVTVDGSGAVWTNTSGISVGDYGTGTLDVLNGGAVNTGSSIYIAAQAGSTGTMLVDASSVDTDDTVGNLVAGDYGTGNLTIQNGSNVISYKGRVAYHAGSSGSTATVSNSTWTNSSDFYVGVYALGELTLQNGSTLSCTKGRVGYQSGSSGSAVTVSDSAWTCSSDFHVGTYASGELTVSAGGQLSDTYGILGYGSGGTGTVTVTGNGSQWSNSERLEIGHEGTGTLNISNGGAVSTGSTAWIGRNAGSNGTILIDDGSLNAGTNRLVVGGNGTGELTIQNGGTATCASGRIGYYDGTDGHQYDGSHGEATVTGAGSTWTCSGDFHVSTYDYGKLTISDGGKVSNTSASIGYNGTNASSGAEGIAIVTGTDSLWESTGKLYVARANGAKGTLTIQDSGEVTCVEAAIANSSGSTGSVVVDGGTWTNTSYVYVADGGTGTLDITNGGVATNTGDGIVGRYSGANGTVTLSGTNSEWNTSNRLYIGHEGNGSMTVGSGTLVTSGNGARIGYNASSEGEVVVNGGTWQSSNDHLMIGSLGTSTGSLEITNGGQVINSAQAEIGFDESASGTATVSGTGSLWSNNSLRVGEDATGTLAISGGGSVTAVDHIHIGQHENSNGTATVTGSGSSLSTPGRLIVGNAGVGVLNINNDATVTARNTHVNNDQSATSSGTINFTNGTLEAGTLFADVNNDLTGTGTVNTNGLVVDVAITLDNPSDLTATFTGLGTGGNVTINLDAGATVPYSMGAGYTGTGSLTLSDEVVLTSTNGHLAYQSTATATASVTGDGTAWYVDNNLDVGRYGAATLEIADGGLVTSSGLTIDADIADGDAGAVADSYIQMKTGGQLALFADLDSDELGDDLSASIGDFLTAVSGTTSALQWWDGSDWASLTTATLGTDCTLEYLTTGDLAGYTMLTVGGETPLAGDANRDGKVDGSDVTILANNWQKGVTPPANAIWEDGDFNGDGKVDGSDVTILANNWQAGVSTVAASVPEPSTLIMLIALAIGSLCWRSR